MSRSLVFWFAVLLLFAGAITSWFGLKQLRARSEPGAVSVKDDAPPGAEADEKLTAFQFKDQRNQDFGSRDLHGKVWIGSFFFADCHALCVVQNNEIAKLHRRFADQGVETVSISVTPDKDPPHKLKSYAERFNMNDHEHWRFLTGKDIDYVRKVGADVFALTAADETHTAHVAVFDRHGQRRGAHKVTSPQEYLKLVRLIEEVLAEEPDAPSRPDSTVGDLQVVAEDNEADARQVEEGVDG